MPKINPDECVYCEEGFEHNDESPEAHSGGRFIGFAHARCLERDQYRQGASCCDYGCRGPCRGRGARGEDAI